MNPAGQLVKFAYSELANGKAFLTAQIAGNEVVCSVILSQPEHPFSREGVESHFDHGSNFWSKAAFKVARSEDSRKLVKGHCLGRMNTAQFETLTQLSATGHKIAEGVTAGKPV